MQTEKERPELCIQKSIRFFSRLRQEMYLSNAAAVSAKSPKPHRDSILAAISSFFNWIKP